MQNRSVKTSAGQTCIGLDIGRSSVKIEAVRGEDRLQLLIPSAVCSAFNITNDAEAERASRDTVLVRGKQFFIGETALIQGQSDMTNGFRDDFVFSDQHAALFLGSLKRLTDEGMAGVDAALIVVGLPANLYAAQKVQLTQELASLAPRAEIRVMPQPLGPYQAMMFNVDGTENTGVDFNSQSWAVVEVGQFTTDYALLIQGRPIENASGSCDGMSKAAENLQRELVKQNISVSMVEATNALITKTIKNYGQTVDISGAVAAAVEPIATQIIDKATQLFGKHARTLDGVLVAGGGAPLTFPTMVKNWPHTQLPENSRFAVATGFCRFALALNLYRAAQAQPEKAAA